MILFFSIILTIFFSNFTFCKDCDNYYFFNFGIKTFCELNDGNPVSCFGSLSGVRYAYIQCEKGYYQKENISQQILECNNNGEWSDELMTCTPECIEPPNELKLIEDNNIEYPPWYVEIIRKTPIQGKVNKIPGMIFFEREIVTLQKYVGNYEFSSEFAEQFLIRVYDTKTSYKNYTIYDIDCTGLNSDLNVYCVIEMTLKEFIKYNKDKKPVCTDNPKFDPNFFIYFHIGRNKRAPYYVGACIVPRITDPKIEIVCFKDNPKYDHLINGNTTNSVVPIDCREEPSLVITRCRIGYQYKKPSPTDSLTSCVINNWYYERNNGCDFKCGEINESFVQLITTRIYNGNEIDITSTPWHVGIFANHTIVSKTYEQICGGTIIHSNIIISAAHCFYDEANNRIYDESNYLVGTGKNFRNFSTVEKNSIYSEIKKIHVTENYQSTDILNDIAILILKEHLQYSRYIQPACIDFNQYKDYSIKDGIKGSITGWGPTSTFGESSNQLLSTSLTTLTNNQCKALLNPKFRSQIVGDKFCAIKENNATACQGDSGGGFIVKKDIGLGERYYLIGIISSGIDRSKHCSDGFLTTFTNIQFYQNFIMDIISEERNEYYY